MARYFQRIGTQKFNFQVAVTIVSLELEVTEPNRFKVEWRRGPLKDQTGLLEISTEQRVALYNHAVSKVSTFRKDLKKNKFQKKLCTFKVKEAIAGGGSKKVGQIDIDMAPLIGVVEETKELKVYDSIYPGTVLTVMFSVQETAKEADGSDGEEKELERGAEEQIGRSMTDALSEGDIPVSADAFIELREENARLRKRVKELEADLEDTKHSYIVAVN